jgi:hypothetical protein
MRSAMQFNCRQLNVSLTAKILNQVRVQIWEEPVKDRF